MSHTGTQGLGTLPDDGEKLLLYCKDGQVLPLLQDRLLLCKLTAGLTLLLHVIRKLLLCPGKHDSMDDLPTLSLRSKLAALLLLLRM